MEGDGPAVGSDCSDRRGSPNGIASRPDFRLANVSAVGPELPSADCTDAPIRLIRIIAISYRHTNHGGSSRSTNQPIVASSTEKSRNDPYHSFTSREALSPSSSPVVPRSSRITSRAIRASSTSSTSRTYPFPSIRSLSVASGPCSGGHQSCGTVVSINRPSQSGQVLVSLGSSVASPQSRQTYSVGSGT
jgi:hypothetical protein